MIFLLSVCTPTQTICKRQNENRISTLSKRKHKCLQIGVELKMRVTVDLIFLAQCGYWCSIPINSRRLCGC